MPFEFIQIPANGQGSAKEELNRLLRGGRIASVKKEFVSNGDDSFRAFPHQSQRDCVSKRRVVRNSLPWVKENDHHRLTPTALDRDRLRHDGSRGPSSQSKKKAPTP